MKLMKNELGIKLVKESLEKGLIPIDMSISKRNNYMTVTFIDENLDNVVYSFMLNKNANEYFKAYDLDLNEIYNGLLIDGIEPNQFNEEMNKWSPLFTKHIYNLFLKKSIKIKKDLNPLL